MYLVDIVRCLLVDVIVNPIAIEQVGMGSPCHQWTVGWVVVSIIILGQVDIIADILVTPILFVERVRGILQMTRNEELTSASCHNDAYPTI